MKVLVIDPVTATITEREWDGGRKQLQKWIRSASIVQARKVGDYTLWVDTVTREKTPGWYNEKLYPEVVTGVGVVTGEKIPALTDALQHIRWRLLFDPLGPAHRA